MEEERGVLKVFSIEELDHFWKKVSMDLEREITDEKAHMIFTTRYHKPKKYNQLEQTPMYRMKSGRMVGAQRISYFLHTNLDVRKKSHLFLRCGQSNCINPHHLIYLPTERERNEYVNK